MYTLRKIFVTHKEAVSATTANLRNFRYHFRPKKKTVSDEKQTNSLGSELKVLSCSLSTASVWC